MRFKNISPLGDLEVPALGRIVQAKETVEIPEEIAPSFAAQTAVWKPIKTRQTDAPAAETREEQR